MWPGRTRSRILVVQSAARTCIMSSWRVSVSVLVFFMADMGVSRLAFDEVVRCLIPHPGVWPGNLGIFQNI